MTLDAAAMGPTPSTQTATICGPCPVAFGAPERALLGFYHAPVGDFRRDISVVLCNPVGYEAMCTHQTYRHLAERLAARGIAALRFDYQGTGDSSGESNEPDRLGAWLASIDAAITEVRARSGVRAVGLFGVRFGATLAATAAANRGDIDDLLMWAPLASGRDFLRELRAFRMIKRPGSISTPPREGGEEAAGYFFDRETVAAIRTINLTARTGSAAKRILIVSRDDLPGTEIHLAKHFERQGAAVRVASEPGYARMMRDPQETVVPTATLDKLAAWVEEGARTESATPRSEPDPPPSLAVFVRVKGETVRERAVLFGEGRRLFGVVTEPGFLQKAGRPALVFLNVGANHRVGPNRMYVSLARDLAAHGYLCLRFDVAGLGDSIIASGGQENRLYSKDSLGDVKAAFTFLSETYGVNRFVLAGLCSGAYLAFHTCVEDARVVGQILMNPQTFEWKEGDSLELSSRNSFLSTRYYARALFKPSTWKRAARGQISVALVASVLRKRLATRTTNRLRSLIARALLQAEPTSEVARAFRAISNRGVDTMLIFSFNDGGLDMIETHLGRGARAMRGRKNFRLEIVDEADHTFTPLESQATLHKLILRDVTTHFP